MKASFLVAGLALALGGCITIPNPVSQTQVYELENSYGVVQTQAVAYASLPFCPAGTSVSDSVRQLCSLRSAVIQIGAADKSARTALDLAESFVRNNPTLSATSVVAAAQQAVAAAQQIEANFGVHQ